MAEPRAVASLSSFFSQRVIFQSIKLTRSRTSSSVLCRIAVRIVIADFMCPWSSRLSWPCGCLGLGVGMGGPASELDSGSLRGSGFLGVTGRGCLGGRFGVAASEGEIIAVAMG